MLNFVGQSHFCVFAYVAAKQCWDFNKFGHCKMRWFCLRNTCPFEVLFAVYGRSESTGTCLEYVYFFFLVFKIISWTFLKSHQKKQKLIFLSNYWSKWAQNFTANSYKHSAHIFFKNRAFFLSQSVV